jgi:predicted nucleotidyltransferase
MMKMSEDFADFLKLLSDKNVDYVLVGGYAVVHYGYVRNTGDMDIWVRSAADNLRRTAEALEELGYVPREQTLPYLAKPNKILRMGIPPFRLEVSTSTDGVDFDDCYTRRVALKVNDVPVSMISFEDLIKNKKASGRLKDLADVEELLKVNS